MLFSIPLQKWLYGACVLTLLALATLFIHDLGIQRQAVSASADGNWGLYFPPEGGPPIGNTKSEDLLQYGAYYIGDPEDKTLYLTFDAGFENGYTSSILDTLKKQEVPAAFFLVGHYLESRPDLVKRMQAEGHIVGNHTYHHPDMTAIQNAEKCKSELTTLAKKYKEVTGAEMPPFYRPPQGKYSPANLQMAKDLGYHTIFWSLAYKDWLQDDQPTADAALQSLLPRTHPGAIILLHSTSKTNAEVLDTLITRWKEAGYRFGTLEELVE